MSPTPRTSALHVNRPAAAAGLAATAAGIALLGTIGVWHAALGVELIALAFWLWARAATDAREQMARWGWLRRPAMALWLAAALAAALPEPASPPLATIPGLASALEVPEFSRSATPSERDPLAPLRALQALAVLWAGLELLGAVPASRPYPDVTGPLPHAGPWLPAMLPAAGFLVLWRQADAWTSGPLMRELAVVLLTVAAALAVLRAYSRRSWTASLRWLAAFDSALAALLVALNATSAEVAFLLWFAAAGGRLMALAAEVRGASGRRGSQMTLLWRLAGWSASASLSWMLLANVVYAGGRLRLFEYAALGAPIYLAAVLSLRRVVEAPDRRSLSRTDPSRLLGGAAALLTAAVGPAALALAFGAGLRTPWLVALLSGVPAALALLPRPRPGAQSELPPLLRGSVAVGASARDFSLSVFRFVITFERQLASAIGALLRGLGAPARDLHTGDAQEYLLFLVGLSVLALLLPLLR